MCNHCGDCVSVCPTKALSIQNDQVCWNPTLCVNCDACIHTCKHHASAKIRMMSVSELMDEVNRYCLFIRGITVSGGECMNHADFLQSFFQEVKKHDLSVLIDSNGFHDFTKYQSLLALSDGVMLDVKAADPEFHQFLCKQSNENVLRNLTQLLEMGKLYEVRTVLLPNQDEQNKKTIAYVVKQIKNRCRYKLIAYRPFGVSEAGLCVFGKTALQEAQLKEYARYAQSLGCEQVYIV